MYVRVIRGEVKAGQADEVARRWEAFVPPRLKEAPGFRNAYFGGDRARTRIVSVTLRENEPDRARAEQLAREFAAQVGDLLDGTPAIEEYEVLVEV